MTMAVIVPSRKRPHNIERLADAWASCDTEAYLIVGIDDDDDTSAYAKALTGMPHCGLNILPRTNMNGTLNELAVELSDTFDYIGFMGDDHLPQTHHWDSRIVTALSQGPCRMAYGNDLFQGPLLPTAIFMDARIIRAVGYMAPPELKHLFLDNTWVEWGKALGTMTYLPDVIIEHVHPHAGKADHDEGYGRVNSKEVWDHDEQVFKRYKESGGLYRDVELMRGAMAVTV